MVSVLMYCVFDCRIIDDEGEYCCARFVSPEARSMLNRKIAKLVKVFGELHLGNDPCLF